jgi:hypothetical protein
MKVRYIISILVFLIIIYCTGCYNLPDNPVSVERNPQLFPDYTSLIIPPNIAPLNFRIEEKGSEYMVEISSKTGNKIRIKQESPDIQIPEEKWHHLIEGNIGNPLKIDVYVMNEKWYKYLTICDTIAHETIDDHLVYRLIGLVYADGDKLGIYQRNLENFDQKVIFENTNVPDHPCINCHSFSNYSPDRMSMHIRKGYNGTVIYDKGKYTKYNTKTDYTMAPGAYTAWHPNGELAAFSLNRLYVYFTADEDKLCEVADQVSDIVLYNYKTNTVSTSPFLASKYRETAETWSADGRWLYYIQGPETDKKNISTWVNSRYDLMRIPFEAEKLAWGEPEMLLSAKETGKSITWPAPSPDGRYVLFCMIDHSYFSIFDRKCDLYLLDLKTHEYRKADVLNSEFTDSYHSWSKNGRWIVFSSKRMDEVSTRLYLAYFDESGKFHKPFVIPQRNPGYYPKFRFNYNVPVFVDGEVMTDTALLRQAVMSKPVPVRFDGTVNIDTTFSEEHMNMVYY